MIENHLFYRVPYADTDQMGFVYYANYLVYFERGRNELLRQCELPYTQLENDGVMLPVIEAHLTYHRPARYDDALDIVSRMTEIRGIRVKMECEVMRNDDELLVKGYTWHAVTDAHGKPQRMPETIKRIFESE